MPDDVQRLLSQAERFARLTDRLSVSFAEELATVLRDLDRELVRLVADARSGNRTATALAVRAGELRRALREVLRAAGYDALVDRASRRALDEALEVLGRTDVGRTTRRFVTQDVARLEALRTLRVGEMVAKGDEAAIALWRTLVRGLYAQQPVAAIVEDLAEALDLEFAEARTLYDTATAVYGREIEALKSGPEDVFLYSGPIDNQMRPFCLQHIGKVFSRAAIDALDNGQLADTFLTGGGYNCRHIWMRLSALDEDAAKADTGERLEFVTESLADVQPKKRARAA